MSDVTHEAPAACPACAVTPLARREAARGLRAAEAAAPLVLSLPGIRCAGCISGVERALQAHPGVRSARVNLTLKRASIEAGAEVSADRLVEVLDRAGYEAHELDATALSATGTDRAGR